MAEKFTYRNGSRSKQKIKNKILLKEIEKIIRLINENKTVVLLAAVSLFITAAHKKKELKTTEVLAVKQITYYQSLSLC